MPPPPLFSVGVIADVQYADMADSHVEGRTQRFREVPAKLEAAVADLCERAAAGKLAAVVTMGDIINGNREDAALTPSDLETVAAILDKLVRRERGSVCVWKAGATVFGVAALGLPSLPHTHHHTHTHLPQPPTLPTHHVLGNHCLDLPKADVLTRLRVPTVAPTAHYAAPLAPGWRLLVLDTTEMSGHAQDGGDSAAAREATAWLDTHPLGDAHPQASPWNGGLTSSQLAWAREQVEAAAAAGERVVVAAHHQAGPGACVRRSHAAWNHDEIAAALTAPTAEDKPSPVVLYLAGHDHEGGYAVAEGVHWVTVEAMCEAPPESNAYAILHFHDDAIEVEGVGAVTSRELKL